MFQRAFTFVLATLLCTTLAACQRNLSPLERGERTFIRLCATCHGPDAKGGPRPGFVIPPRDLTLPQLQASISDAELTQFIRQGKGQMPGFGVLLSDEELAQLVAYLRSLARNDQSAATPSPP